MPPARQKPRASGVSSVRQRIHPKNTPTLSPSSIYFFSIDNKSQSKSIHNSKIESRPTLEGKQVTKGRLSLAQKINETLARLEAVLNSQVGSLSSLSALPPVSALPPAFPHYSPPSPPQPPQQQPASFLAYLIRQRGTLYFRIKVPELLSGGFLPAFCIE